MNSIFTSRSLLNVSLFITLAALATGVHAQPGQDAKPDSLRAVMEQLGDDMQAITGAISHEDWARVAELAPKIANHAEPPAEERVKIITWLGADAPEFRGYDLKVKETAVEMGDAAKQADGMAVIAAFSKMQQNCLACHQSFRQPIIKQFYENR